MIIIINTIKNQIWSIYAFFIKKRRFVLKKKKIIISNQKISTCQFSIENYYDTIFRSEK